MTSVSRHPGKSNTKICSFAAHRICQSHQAATLYTTLPQTFSDSQSWESSLSMQAL